MTYENLLLEKKDRIATLCINRPKALNALNRETLLELKDAASSIAQDEEIDLLIITGTGDKAFVAGADIAYMQNLSALEARSFAALGQQVFMMIETMAIPVIAAVNGFALGGGCELAMCCDFRIASSTAKFGQPEVGLGIIPGFGGTQRLTRLIGTGMAKQLLYAADVINADEAFRIGLVNSVQTPDKLMDFVEAVAKRILAQGQVAVRLCKSAANEGLQTDINRGMTIESDAFGLCFATADQKEGMTAFIEKRKSRFIGK